MDHRQDSFRFLDLPADKLELQDVRVITDMGTELRDVVYKLVALDAIDDASILQCPAIALTSRQVHREYFSIHQKIHALVK